GSFGTRGWHKAGEADGRPVQAVRGSPARWVNRLPVRPDSAGQPYSCFPLPLRVLAARKSGRFYQPSLEGHSRRRCPAARSPATCYAATLNLVPDENGAAGGLPEGVHPLHPRGRNMNADEPSGAPLGRPNKLLVADRPHCGCEEWEVESR